MVHEPGERHWERGMSVDRNAGTGDELESSCYDYDLGDPSGLLGHAMMDEDYYYGGQCIEDQHTENLDDHGTNPATGLPMLDGCIDAGGNPYGLGDHNDLWDDSIDFPFDDSFSIGGWDDDFSSGGGGSDDW